MVRSLYSLNDNKTNPCCSILSAPNLFNLSKINNYYLEIYIEKKKMVCQDLTILIIFCSFKTLFEAVLYADLYLRDIGILKLNSVNYNKEWEDLI